MFVAEHAYCTCAYKYVKLHTQVVQSRHQRRERERARRYQNNINGAFQNKHMHKLYIESKCTEAVSTFKQTYFNQNPRQTGLNEQRTVLFSILVSFRNVTFDSHFFFSKDGNRSLSEHGNGSLEPGDNIYHDRKEIIVRISATL